MFPNLWVVYLKMLNKKLHTLVNIPTRYDDQRWILWKNCNLFSSIFLVSSKSKLCFRTPCSGSSLSRRFSSAAAAALYYQHYGGFVQLPFPPTTKNSWLCAYIKWLLLLPSSNNIVVECKNTLSHATQSCEAFSFQMPALRAKMPDVTY